MTVAFVARHKHGRYDLARRVCPSGAFQVEVKVVGPKPDQRLPRMGRREAAPSVFQ
jgi:hypothetical protein